MVTLTEKFQIKPGYKGRVVNKPRGLKLNIRSSAGGRDFVIVFSNDLAELDQLAPEAMAQLREDGLLWFCYPKKSSGIKTDINRDCGWKPLAEKGYRGVRAISINETWSALRFRESRLIKK